MDPNENLKLQRTVRKAVLDCNADVGTCRNCETAAKYLAELSEALDDWIAKGGFLPTAWQR